MENKPSVGGGMIATMTTKMLKINEAMLIIVHQRWICYLMQIMEMVAMLAIHEDDDDNE